MHAGHACNNVLKNRSSLCMAIGSAMISRSAATKHEHTVFTSCKLRKVNQQTSHLPPPLRLQKPNTARTPPKPAILHTPKRRRNCKRIWWQWHTARQEYCSQGTRQRLSSYHRFYLIVMLATNQPTLHESALSGTAFHTATRSASSASFSFGTKASLTRVHKV